MVRRGRVREDERSVGAVLGSVVDREREMLAMNDSHGVCYRRRPGVERVVLCTFALHNVVGLRRGRTGPSSLSLLQAHDAHLPRTSVGPVQ
jgi:hypothetical protein